MITEYKRTKKGIGLYVLLEMDEVAKYSSADSKHIIDNLSFIIDKSLPFSKLLIMKWVARAIADFANEINTVVNHKQVCYIIKDIQIHAPNFREEILYCVCVQWISTFYQLDLPEIPVFFDEEKNTFIFPDWLRKP